MTGARDVATPGTEDVGGPKASEISQWCRTAKWQASPEVEEGDDLLPGQKLKVFPSAWFMDSDWDISDTWPLDVCGFSIPSDRRELRVSKISGLENPSDEQTKYLGPEPLLRLTTSVKCWFMLVRVA